MSIACIFTGYYYLAYLTVPHSERIIGISRSRLFWNRYSALCQSNRLGKLLSQKGRGIAETFHSRTRLPHDALFGRPLLYGEIKGFTTLGSKTSS